MREGQVFILTLGVIVALSALLAGAWVVQTQAQRTAMEALDRVRLEQDFESVRELALFALLTEPIYEGELHYGGRLNPDILEGGLMEAGETVDLRGAPYLVELNGRELVIRLVALNGLLPLDISRPELIRLALVQMGLEPPEADRLTARLMDYTDPDDLKSLNGAEARDYPEDVAPPPNRPLRSPAEACAVLGWEALELCADPRVMDLVFLADIGAPSAPALTPDHVLGALLASDEAETASERLASNSATTFADLGLDGWDLAADPELLGYADAGPGFVLIAHEPDARIVSAQRVDLSLGAIDRPVRRGFHHVIGGEWVESAFRIENPDEIDAFPVPVPEAGDE